MVAEHWLQHTSCTLVKIPGAGASFCLSTAVHRIIGLRIFLIGIGEYLHCCRFCGCGLLVYCGGVSCADRIVFPLSSTFPSSTCVGTLCRQYFQSAHRGQAGDNGVWCIKAQRASLSKISVTGGC